MTPLDSEEIYDFDYTRAKLLSISYKLEQWQVKLNCGLEVPYGYMKTYRYSSPIVTPDIFTLNVFGSSNISRLGKRKVKDDESPPQKKRQRRWITSTSGTKAQQRQQQQQQQQQQQGYENNMSDNRNIFLCGGYELRGKVRQHKLSDVVYTDGLGSLKPKKYRTTVASSGRRGDVLLKCQFSTSYQHRSASQSLGQLRPKGAEFKEQTSLRPLRRSARLADLK